MELTALTFGTPADYGDGLEITVTDVRRSTRDDGKEHVRFVVTVRNGTEGRVDLGNVGVTVRSGPDGRCAKPDFWRNEFHLGGSLAVGRSASSEALYGLAAGTLSAVDIEVTCGRFGGIARMWSGAALDDSAADPPEGPTEERRAEILDEAVRELTEMIGLEPVKRQVRMLTARLRMAALRESYGLPRGTMSHHMVFSGPPGTGKTTVARIVGKVFAGLGLLAKGHLVEAGRADLVGRYVGHTAPLTNAVVDRALDGVLFIDEAYSLCNTQGRSGDRDVFGDEAIQVLLKRAEEDRHRLVVILAGYDAEIAALLASNPGLTSRFTTRVDFPAYAGREVAAIARSILAAAGETLTPEADEALSDCCALVDRYAWADALGNGRFARTLTEKARAHRDLRLADGLADHRPTTDELTTVHPADLTAAFAALTRHLASEASVALP